MSSAESITHGFAILLALNRIIYLRAGRCAEKGAWGKLKPALPLYTLWREMLRFKYDVDLLAAMEKMVKDEKITNAVILAGAGSVRGYQVHQVSNRTFPSKNMYVKDPTAPADLIGMNGYVIGGKIHAHMTLANPDHAFGGHLEPGTRVFTFAIVTIGVMNEGVDFSHFDDKSYR
jgi:predicted DNA-binding protein with PD1-like motif